MKNIIKILTALATSAGDGSQGGQNLNDVLHKA